jgi:hypothetical protein
MRERALSIFPRRSRMLFSSERSFSRSKVAVPESAYSSSKATSPETSDWGVEKEDSSSSASCALSSSCSFSSEARSSSSSLLVKIDLVAMAEGT